MMMMMRSLGKLNKRMSGWEIEKEKFHVHEKLGII
jgi:hypothetical protein